MPPRGQRMDVMRKTEHVKMVPVQYFKLCASMGHGDQGIVGRCMHKLRTKMASGVDAARAINEIKAELHLTIEGMLRQRLVKQKRKLLLLETHIDDTRPDILKVHPRGAKGGGGAKGSGGGGGGGGGGRSGGGAKEEATSKTKGRYFGA
eukprot:6186522-Pleurochrysis_carterae.AAC.1